MPSVVLAVTVPITGLTASVALSSVVVEVAGASFSVVVLVLGADTLGVVVLAEELDDELTTLELSTVVDELLEVVLLEPVAGAVVAGAETDGVVTVAWLDELFD